MEYFYTAMFLNEVGLDIDGTNIRKIFNALNIEVDDAKAQFLSHALPLLTTTNKKKVGSSNNLFHRQSDQLQKHIETFENSLVKFDESLTELKQDKVEVCKSYLDNKKYDDIIHGLNARYIYGISGKGVRVELETKGLNGALVYTIPYKEICVVVHDCLDEPYKSDDEAVVKEWLFTQQEVLDEVIEKFGVVLPMSFDMIIKEKDGGTLEQTIKSWLEDNYEKFVEKVSGLRGKQEFGVQVILDTEILSSNLIEIDEKLRTKMEEIESKPEGIAYMEKEVLKELLKEKIEESADQYFREFFNRIKRYTDDIVIGKVKKVGGSKQMLMNLSCLVKKDRVEELGKELENIENINGISVRFSGPWAPYSFVTPEKVVTKDG